MHDPTKVLLGVTLSSFKTVDNHPGTIAAGLIARKKSDGSVSILASDGEAIGISIGKDMSGIGRTAVVRRGTRVPVQLTAAFNPVVGAQVFISDTTGLAIAEGAGATGVNATYAEGRIGGSGVNGGIQEDGTSVGAALIDFPGGL